MSDRVGALTRSAPGRLLDLAVVGLLVGAFVLPISRADATTGDPVLLNELLVSHTGADTTEFFELYGAPGLPLGGLSLVVVEGDGSTAGTLDLRVDFPADATLGGNGFYLVGNPAGLSANYGVTPDLALTCPAPPCSDLVENGSQTVALVATPGLGSVGAVVSGDEDVRDAVGLTDAGPSDAWFWLTQTPVLGPDDGFLPPGARRLTDGADTDTAADWAFADDLLGPANTPTAATPFVPPPPPPPSEPEPEPEPDPEPAPMDLTALAGQLQTHVASGAVAQSKAHLLLDRLARVERFKTDGQYEAAVAQLLAFANQVNGLAPRWVEASVAEELAQAALSLVP